MSNFSPKDPADVDVFQIGFKAELSVGETIETATVTVEPAGALVVLSPSQINNGGTAVAFILSGGMAGNFYSVTALVVTSLTRTLSRSKTVVVAEL